MMHLILRSACMLALAAALGLGGGPARADDYPVRPIRMLVPAPAGGGTDVLARILAEGLTRELGQPIIIDNRGGASGMIAADIVLQSPPDGYTLFMVYSGVLTANQAIFPKISYDPIRDFTTIANFADVPNLLIVHPDFPVKTVADLIALAKSRPDGVMYASSGNGVSNHLAMALFEQMAGVSMVHVPYKGGSPAMMSLMGGQIQLMFNNMVEVVPQIRNGRVRAIAIATAQRSPLMPELPTVSESGLPGYSISLWYGVVGPRGMSPDVILRLNEAIRRVQADPQTREKLARLGATPVSQTQADFAAMIRSEVAKWSEVVKKANIRPD